MPMSVSPHGKDDQVRVSSCWVHVKEQAFHDFPNIFIKWYIWFILGLWYRNLMLNIKIWIHNIHQTPFTCLFIHPIVGDKKFIWDHNHYISNSILFPWLQIHFIQFLAYNLSWDRDCSLTRSNVILRVELCVGGIWSFGFSYDIMSALEAMQTSIWCSKD